MQSPLILLAHGSRNPDWLQSLEMGCEIFRQHGDREARLAYMELASPTLDVVVNSMAEEGHTELQILPLFFAPGRHLQQDIPEQIQQLESQLPGVAIKLLPALGEKAGFWRFLAEFSSAEN